MDLFPTWRPVPADREPCEECGAAFESAKPNRSATKLQVSLEKARAGCLQKTRFVLTFSRLNSRIYL